MTTKRKVFIIIISLISIFFIYHYTSTNDFYENTGEDFGLFKIPLIEPVRLLSTESKGNWSIRFDSAVIFMDHYHVDSIAVVDSMIIWNDLQGIQLAREYHWFLWNVKTKKPKFFTTKSDLDFYLKNIVNEKINYYTPQYIYMKIIGRIKNG
jgi:hypothetical protein